MSWAVGVSYGALVIVTALAAAAAALAGTAVWSVGTPHDALPATVTTTLELLLVNVPVAVTPLALIALRWHTIPIARGVADVLIAGNVTSNGLLVGGALGQQPELWRFLPHLPFEWLALSLPVAAWMLARRDVLTGNRLGRLTTATLAALVLAAGLETWAVPL